MPYKEWVSEKLARPQSTREILKGTARQFRSLQGEGARLYSLNGDRVSSRKKFHEAGALIANLPDRLQQAVDIGQGIPSEALQRIEGFAEDARDYLERGDYFGLS